MAIDATSSATSGGSVTSSGRASLASTFDTFLALLTTQMKNQDPLSPMDSTEFTNQLVQMTGVEQQLLTNDLLQSLVNTAGRGIADAVSLIGKEVRAVSDDAAIQNGEAKWVYKQDRDAASVKVEVLDASGKIVHAEEVDEIDAGEHAFTWDGKDLTGKQLSDGGVYTLRVTAVDGSGAAVPTTTYIDGLVTAVEQADGETLITVAGAKVNWETVTKIAQVVSDEETPATTNPIDEEDEEETSNLAA
jgi:flagellar basal-body rod modification protein FlgD